MEGRKGINKVVFADAISRGRVNQCFPPLGKGSPKEGPPVFLPGQIKVPLYLYLNYSGIYCRLRIKSLRRNLP